MLLRKRLKAVLVCINLARTQLRHDHAVLSPIPLHRKCIRTKPPRSLHRGCRNHSRFFSFVHSQCKV